MERDDIGATLLEISKTKAVFKSFSSPSDDFHYLA
jgi:hypothetical protein